MKKFLASFMALALLAVIATGCSQSTSPTNKATATKVVYLPATLCAECGQLESGKACCAEGAEACSKCNLHKGAPGCCKMEKGTEATLCASCGEIKGGEACCAEGAETCSKCNLHKGAPGCCKLKVATDTGNDHSDKKEEKKEKEEDA